MLKNIKYGTFLLALLIAASCKKPYSPVVKESVNNFLVVEGFINPGADSTFIKLSRTVQLADSAKVTAERGATVTVEGNGIGRPLTEISPGVYSGLPLNVDVSQKYHLRIRLANGKEYVSDEAEAKVTPPIDTVTFAVKPDGIIIYASAHDPSNKTRYYRWDYDETWMFHSKYASNFKVENGEVVPRPPAEQIYLCFANHTSSVVSLATTTKLTADVVSNAPITNISRTSEKISVRYSMMLRQYALTKEAFDFWENLRKNTENLGSIFDAQPSQISGNIHNVSDASEPVIGFISVSTMASKRVFIDREDINQNWVPQYPYDCREDSTLFKNPKTGSNDVNTFLIMGSYLPTFEIIANGSLKPVGYGRTSPECADCTLRGYRRRPAFWKDK
ncbi:DUF4249 domain-containing protein [Mucilaginibacter pedocola]|uniref:DUF4249 domain-containing protein n=1 Tax=Mucilaginibacter pedocola TaxID=1792845 RepID=A0A1S9PDQ3_9SPHI|nr:DUF4249 domain-containing protein [Mucilaginibacter pedocola]OOQ59075.1 hypothetical protein BC343_29610 [Mucilaginibacter pedocola]